MKKLIGLVIVVVIAFVMAMTVPDKKAHKSAMMKAVKEYVDEEAANRGFADNGLTRVGKNLVVKTIEEVLSNKLRVTNYFLFNTTHIEMKEKDKLLSVGMFGHVFTFDKEMLRDALEGSAERRNKGGEETIEGRGQGGEETTKGGRQGGEETVERRGQGGKGTTESREEEG